MAKQDLLLADAAVDAFRYRHSLALLRSGDDHGRVTGTHTTWPFIDLEVHTPRLRLRYADDDLLEELATFRGRGVARPGYEWVDGESSFYMESPRAEWAA